MRGSVRPGSTTRAALLLLLTPALAAGCGESEPEAEAEAGAEEEPESPVPPDAEVELIAEGFEFTEGPYWLEDRLVFSDIPADRVYEWLPDADSATVFLEPSGHANGITADDEDRLLLAQHDGRVVRVEEEGELEVVADGYEGERLNSPNDLVVASDGAVYFTDPPYGVDEDERELDFSGVYRLEPDGEPELLTDAYEYPNGLTFSPDGSTFYVNDSGENAIWAYDVEEDGSISGERTFAEPSDPDADGSTDGMKVDTEGNLYTTGPGGVWIYTPDGERLDRIDVPVPPTNLAFGEPDLTMLYITARDNVYRVPLDVPGVQ